LLSKLAKLSYFSKHLRPDLLTTKTNLC